MNFQMETQGTDNFGVKSKNNNDSSGAKNSESASSTDSAESHCSTSTSHGMGGIASKPHKANDANWQAINLLKSRQPNIGLSNFRLLKRVGAGDIGTVYLAQLKGTTCQFAIKVMDKESLKSRKKLMRAHTEREILALLDHPFLPTMYTYFETEKFLCIVMEYCSGGDLHNLRQKQPKKHFSESAARFYASEVLVALEYLHMMGIVYRDLKPENVLVTKAGHIMLSDFDLSLRCDVSPTLLVRSASCRELTDTAESNDVEADLVTRSCMSQPCLFPRLLTHKKKSREKPSSASEWGAPEILAEPSSARSMSFVGTHEYLAPEIIKGDGHGSAVDWWTYGVLLYELLHGRTPFKGETNHTTLLNVVRQPLRFPDTPTVSGAARDLIRGLLEKDPRQRLACAMGASQIKHHPFFHGVNWALIRAAPPPRLPPSNSLSPAPAPPPPPQNEPRRRRSPMATATATAPAPPAVSAASRRSPTRPRSQSQSRASTPVSVCTSDDYYIDFTNLY